MLRKKKQQQNQAFSAFHINIRSLPKHFNDPSEYLLSLNMLFSVVAVSETWLHKFRFKIDMASHKTDYLQKGT